MSPLTSELKLFHIHRESREERTSALSFFSLCVTECGGGARVEFGFRRRRAAEPFEGTVAVVASRGGRARTVATFVFRCDTVLLFGPIGIELLLSKSVSLLEAIKCCVITALLCIEFYLSHDRGKTHPLHWYFTSALPRSMLVGYPLCMIGMVLDRRIRRYVYQYLSDVCIFFHTRYSKEEGLAIEHFRNRNFTYLLKSRTRTNHERKSSSTNRLKEPKVFVHGNIEDKGIVSSDWSGVYRCVDIWIGIEMAE
ncbi:Dol-P-Man:Man(7)GlcNAc(2)-PP-Dol alpha-1,6-mannosyltransferase [Ananas comosus]|uniref:Mannosyltransferase n=1 Tax=Ananas comosus TaxID=4615 RepID=A0A199W614_ANACO|nr:Dol-P-Man:Man(7)GlcNAc(2)-PP-Dol alpha-1,6-mannosyltransferase [Ananas comosus]